MNLSFPRRRDSQAIGKHKRHDAADSKQSQLPGPSDTN